MRRSTRGIAGALGAKTVLLLALCWAAFCLSVLGVTGYVILHFVTKFW